MERRPNEVRDHRLRTRVTEEGGPDYVEPAAEPGIRALFPQAALLSIADAGHWVHADQPAALLRALQDWLAKTHGAPAR